MSDVFTILNLPTFDGVKYMENGNFLQRRMVRLQLFHRGRALPTDPGLDARQRSADGYVS